MVTVEVPRLRAWALVFLVLGPSFLLCQGQPALLIGSSDGDALFQFDLDTQQSLQVLGPSLGLRKPDHIVLRGNYLYVSQDDTSEGSSILRYNIVTGKLDPFFVVGGAGAGSSNTLLNPYGFDFYQGVIYVSSFLTDQILMYNETNGSFVGIFAQGNGTESGLCNGPNQIAIHEGTLYLTTQGSTVINGSLEYLFVSQIVAYDLETGVGSVFIPQPEPEPRGGGYVSMLGILIGCNDRSIDPDICTMYTTDFAGGLRAYPLVAGSAPYYVVSTTYAPGANTGSLTYSDDDDSLYVVGFVRSTGAATGAVLRFDAKTGFPKGILPDSAVLVENDDAVIRPIGVLWIDSPITPVNTLGSLLITNTRSDSVSRYDFKQQVISDYLTDQLGVVSPDHMVLRGDYLYVSVGGTADDSAILRFNLGDGTFDLEFATAGRAMVRPYGFDFFNGILYVASFLTDQILTFNETTGAYLGVFAQGNGTESGLCNGPNQIAIHSDGILYMTTQGSTVINGTLEYLFASQVVAYDLETGEGSVFIPQPTPDLNGLGFISMLGVIIGCGEQSAVESGECTMFTSDFAGGLRAYRLNGPELIYSVSTSFVPGAITGNLILAPSRSSLAEISTGKNAGSIYLTGYDENNLLGTVQEFDAGTGELLGSVVSSIELARPIGILYLPPTITKNEAATVAPTEALAPFSRYCPRSLPCIGFDNRIGIHLTRVPVAGDDDDGCVDLCVVTFFLQGYLIATGWQCGSCNDNE